VLWLSHFVPFPPTGHGALQRSHHLLREAARRHEVHLMSVAVPAAHQAPGSLPEAVAALRQIVATVDVFPLAPDSRLRQAGLLAASLLGGRSYWQRRFLVPAMLDRTRAALRSGFDVIHVDIVFLAEYFDAARGAARVLNHHNIESDLLQRRSEMYADAVRRGYLVRAAARVRALERRLAADADANLVVSALDAARLREGVPSSDPILVPNGVDVEYFRPAAGIAEERGRLVFAGGMDWFPNREAMEYFAREIWPALVADDPSRRVSVMGRNPPPDLLRLARMDERVDVQGFVDDVRPAITRAPVYVCPIRVGGGTRLKILDALAMERALVSTDLGVEGLGLEPDVHYLRANSPAEFVAQVRRIEEDAALRARLGAAGRAVVEQRYSWARVGQRLDEAYARAVAVRRSRSPAVAAPARGSPLPQSR
jgi:glycosyltransferase involved in cell wall biosynthesis